MSRFKKIKINTYNKTKRKEKKLPEKVSNWKYVSSSQSMYLFLIKALQLDETDDQKAEA